MRAHHHVFKEDFFFLFPPRVIPLGIVFNPPPSPHVSIAPGTKRCSSLKRPMREKTMEITATVFQIAYFR